MFLIYLFSLFYSKYFRAQPWYPERHFFKKNVQFPILHSDWCLVIQSHIVPILWIAPCHAAWSLFGTRILPYIAFCAWCLTVNDLRPKFSIKIVVEGSSNDRKTRFGGPWWMELYVERWSRPNSGFAALTFLIPRKIDSVDHLILGCPLSLDFWVRDVGLHVC